MSGKDRLPNVVRDSNAASDGKHSKVCSTWEYLLDVHVCKARVTDPS